MKNSIGLLCILALLIGCKAEKKKEAATTEALDKSEAAAAPKEIRQSGYFGRRNHQGTWRETLRKGTLWLHF